MEDINVTKDVFEFTYKGMKTACPKVVAQYITQFQDDNKLLSVAVKSEHEFFYRVYSPGEDLDTSPWIHFKQEVNTV